MNIASKSRPSTPPGENALWNPWRWMLIALTATGVAFGWARACQGDQVPLDFVQVSLIVVGLLAAGVAIWMRCTSSHTFSINENTGPLRICIFGAIAAFHAAAGLAVSAWVVLKLQANGALPGELGGIVLLWILTVPWAIYSCLQLMRRMAAGTDLSEHFETAVLVTQGGIAALLGSWALFWGPDFREDWDSLRLFVAVLAAVALLAAPLVAANSYWRRVGVSTLIVAHFAAVLTVVLGAPPGPWIINQANNWIFRPYIDFMYLNNAYRFYSPEPGPASQLWFRIEYRHGKDIVSHWTKLPEMDERGRHVYPVRLQHMRQLALTENVSRTDPMPPTMVQNAKGEIELAPFAARRDAHSPEPMYKGKLGYVPVKDSLEVPRHPDPLVPNYQQPTIDGRFILQSIARHVLRQPHPELSDAKPIAVRIYRVQHRIIRPENLANGGDPRDWTLYLPYYMGRFDAFGSLLDPEDPFLYWLLPILHKDDRDPNSKLINYAFKHAGEPKEKWDNLSAPRW